MLLKLVMPQFGRGVEAASVVQWHQKEGMRVNDGDDLLDVKIEEKTIIKPPPGLRELIEMLTDPQFASRVSQDGGRTKRQGGTPGSAYTKVKMPGTVIRIRAAETGLLRKIESPEGEYRSVGDLLALLTTEENEAVADGGPALAEASAFRVGLVPLRKLIQGNQHDRSLPNQTDR
jgi:hypothetical protein